MNDNKKNFYDRLEPGLQYQDFVSKLFLSSKGIALTSFCSRLYATSLGENVQGIEIKEDTRFRQTGNLFIETEEMRSGGMCPAGIMDEHSWLYAIGDRQEVFVFAVNQLRLLAKQFDRVVGAGGNTRGFLLPLDQHRQFVILTLKPNEG